MKDEQVIEPVHDWVRQHRADMTAVQKAELQPQRVAASLGDAVAQLRGIAAEAPEGSPARACIEKALLRMEKIEADAREELAASRRDA